MPTGHHLNFFFVWGGGGWVVVLRELKSIGFVSGNLAYMDGASSLVDIFKKEKWY